MKPLKTSTYSRPMKKTILLGFLALAIPFAATAQNSSAVVIEYVFTLVDFKKVMASAAEADKSASPKVRKMTLDALEAFDITELLHEQSALIEEMLPSSSAQACIRFVETPLAADFVSDLRKGGSIDAALKTMGSRPQSEQMEIASFFQSDCLKGALEVLQSPRFSAAAEAYGAALACNHVRTMNLNPAEAAEFSELCESASH